MKLKKLASLAECAPDLGRVLKLIKMGGAEVLPGN